MTVHNLTQRLKAKMNVLERKHIRVSTGKYHRVRVNDKIKRVKNQIKRVTGA